MISRGFLILTVLFTFTSTSHAEYYCKDEPTYYKVTFYNFLYPDNANFTGKIPDTGLVYSPLAAVSHSIRKSFLTVYGYASPQVELICETGDNSAFLRMAQNEAKCDDLVKSYAGSDGPARPGMSASVILKVTCEQPMITALSMIAPSPDWIVQVNNLEMVGDDGYFVEYRAGPLIAYDCGTDDGGDFTPPADASLDIPSEPMLNIAPLNRDPTDPFGKQPVGSYVITKYTPDMMKKEKGEMMKGMDNKKGMKKEMKGDRKMMGKGEKYYD